jgi:hypothetical protein
MVGWTHDKKAMQKPSSPPVTWVLARLWVTGGMCVSVAMSASGGQGFALHPWTGGKAARGWTPGCLHNKKFAVARQVPRLSLFIRF